MKEGETTQMLAGDHVNCNARRSSLRRARTPQESFHSRGSFMSDADISN
jgi:hypothetical protein